MSYFTGASWPEPATDGLESTVAGIGATAVPVPKKTPANGTSRDVSKFTSFTRAWSSKS